MKTTEATTAVVYHALLIELFYDFREVREGSGKTVDLVNDYGIDSLGGDVSEKALESRPFNVTAGEAAIVIRVERPASPHVAGSGCKLHRPLAGHRAN